MVARSESSSLRVVLYSHDSQGLGHFRRNRALAHALSHRLPVLTGRQVTGLLINGVPEAGADSLPQGFDVVTLPAVNKGVGGYGPKRLDVGMQTVTSVRGDIVRATLTTFRPDLFIVDRHALGVNGELEAGLRALRTEHPQARIVLGLRDVLDSPQVVAVEWARVQPALVRELYDEIWVYGDPRVHDLRRTEEIPTALHDMVRYQGFLSHGRAELPSGLDPEIPYLITTAGGGSDGFRLCMAAARATVPAGHRHVIITGPQMSDADHRAIELAAGPSTTVVRSIPDAAGPIRRAAASISMAGYNTVTETLATDVPALLVPRETPRREQLIRVESLAAHGSVDLLREGDLTPQALTRWWAGAVRRRTQRAHLHLGGLREVARSAARLVCTARTADARTADAQGEGSPETTTAPLAAADQPAATTTTQELPVAV
ncbi:glycosyltransferase family protein [Ornithinimicrobium sufpigmenti]|uniref:glycosyltransferase family protein n=1 Tax=Ornithinimicrobium sufpigmenti TaxID=2508882 RepID=UPI001EDEE798|nr:MULTISPECIES: glycosyltransferase [unclassified Ornithinimicrobium]